MKKTNVLIIRLLIAMLLVSGFGIIKSYTQNVPKNIVVFISDGWSYNHINATKYFRGVDSNTYEQFNVYHPMSTYCSMVVKPWEDTITGYTNSYNSYKAWTDWKWMKRESDGGVGATGSAPAATTMASGMKSSKYAVGVDKDSALLELISERAVELGKAAGVVSSVQFAHATPAGFSAHSPSRKAYADIARNQIIDSKFTVIMGCGNPEYDADGNLVAEINRQYKYVGGQETWDSLKAGTTTYSVASPMGNTEVQDVDGDATPDAWYLIQDSADFATLRTGAVSHKRVIGVPKCGATLQHNRSGNYRDTLPFEVPYTANVPRLHHMTTAALNVLDNNDSDKGFFLMVEGGAVDWAGHGNSLTRIIEEQADFDDAVDSALAWLAAKGELENTLVIVTGDHETDYLTGPDFDTNSLDMIAQYPVSDSGAGNMPGHKFMSFDAYGNGPTDPSGEHTNQLIPFYAQGPGAELFEDYADQEDFVRGRYIDNTDMGHVMFDLWTEESFTMPQPKNTILMVSDGWGYNHINATEYFRGTPAAYKSFTHQYNMSTFPAMVGKVWENDDISKYNTWYQSFGAWTDHNYWATNMTGSAPAATSMYTGKKSAKYAIGVAIDSTELKTFGERGFEAGKSVGVVSSVPLSHATPAAMLAHNINRNAYAQIANEMFIDSRAAVIMGCGAPDYDADAQSNMHGEYKYVGGEGTWNNLLAEAITFDSTTINGNSEVQDIDGDGNPDAWTLIRDSIDVLNMATGKTPLRVACIPNVYKTLNNDRTTGDPSVAYASDLNQNVPMLSDMTKAALNVLDNNANGFSLMIEGGAVDWAGHDNAAGRLIEEQADFDEAVQAVMDWVEDSSSWDETLLIVTGDHECGYFVGENFDTNDIMGTWEVSDNGQGNMPGYKFQDDYHTNQLIPIYMKGDGAVIIAEYADHDDYVLGKYMDNTEIAQGVFKMWKSLPAADPDIKANSIVTSNDEATPKANKQSQNIKVYPSPTSGSLTIEVAEIPALYKVVDVTGNVINMGTLKEKLNTIDISNNNPGVYLIDVQSENEVAAKKVVLK